MFLNASSVPTYAAYYVPGCVPMGYVPATDPNHVALYQNSGPDTTPMHPPNQHQHQHYQRQQYQEPVNSSSFGTVHGGFDCSQHYSALQPTHLADYSGNGPSQTLPTASGPPPGGSDAAKQTPKVARLRKACDSCSIRKVKCDESAHPCPPCAALDIPCTYKRPSRRRGPPNRYAESIKRRRLEDPTEAAQLLTELSSGPSPQEPSAKLISTIENLEELVEDFFTYIYPSYPFPHEPTFREAWGRREHLTNGSFQALLLSMIGALAASFLQNPRLNFGVRTSKTRTFDYSNLLKRCQLACRMARSPGYRESGSLSVSDAATSFFIGQSHLRLREMKSAHLYFMECLSILRILGLHRDDEHFHSSPDTYSNLGSAQGPTIPVEDTPKVDNIDREIGKRTFWALFVVSKDIQQDFPGVLGVFFPPPTSEEPYPPLPSEVDDRYIFSTHTESPPVGQQSIVAIFNKVVRVLRVYDNLPSVRECRSGSFAIDSKQRMTALLESLGTCQDLSHGLSWGSSITPIPEGTIYGRCTDLSSVSETTLSPENPVCHGNVEDRPTNKQEAQHAIQNSSLYASILSTRACILQRLGKLHHTQEPFVTVPSASFDSNVIAPERVIHTCYESASEPKAIVQHIKTEGKQLTEDVLVAVSEVGGPDMALAAHDFTAKSRLVAYRLCDVLKPFGSSDECDLLREFLQALHSLGQASPNEESLVCDSEGQRSAERYRERLTEIATVAIQLPRRAVATLFNGRLL